MRKWLFGILVLLIAFLPAGIVLAVDEWGGQEGFKTARANNRAAAAYVFVSKDNTWHELGNRPAATSTEKKEHRIYTPATDSWSTAATITNEIVRGGADDNPATGDIHVVSGNGVTRAYKWNYSTGTYNTYEADGTSPNPYGVAVLYDSTSQKLRYVALLSGTVTGPTMYSHDAVVPSTGGWTTTVLTGDTWDTNVNYRHFKIGTQHYFVRTLWDWNTGESAYKKTVYKFNEDDATWYKLIFQVADSTWDSNKTFYLHSTFVMNGEIYAEVETPGQTSTPWNSHWNKLTLVKLNMSTLRAETVLNNIGADWNYPRSYSQSTFFYNGTTYYAGGIPDAENHQYLAYRTFATAQNDPLVKKPGEDDNVYRFKEMLKRIFTTLGWVDENGEPEPGAQIALAFFIVVGLWLCLMKYKYFRSVVAGLALIVFFVVGWIPVWIAALLAVAVGFIEWRMVVKAG